MAAVSGLAFDRGGESPPVLLVDLGRAVFHDLEDAMRPARGECGAVVRRQIGQYVRLMGGVRQACALDQLG